MSKKRKSAMMCGHANECPNVCPCETDCYCRVEGSCSGRFKTAAHVRRHQAAKQQPVEVSEITVYATMSENDDGRWTGVIAYFSTRSAAKGYGKGKGAWGGDADVKECAALKLPDGRIYVIEDGPIDIDLEQSKYEEELRKTTLSKLSDEEKRVLGLTDKYGVNDKEK